MRTRALWIVACVAVGVFAVVRVATTLRVFSATADEPGHIAAGHEWWLGEVAFDPIHPPLARALFAVSLRNQPRLDVNDRQARGFFLLYGQPDDIRTLARARLPNLIFLAVAIGVIVIWGRKFGDAVALIAATFAASMPPLLGHAGVATTDMAVAATLPLALLAFDYWIRAPSLGRSILLGIAIALGLLSKFSFLLFFPICAIVIVAVARKRGPLAHLALSAAIAMCLLWPAYRFTLAPLSSIHSVALPPASTMPAAVRWFFTTVPVPAPAFFDGLLILKAKNAIGHPAFLFGRVSDHGFWYYFPSVFFFKTPLPFLVLCIAGVIAVVRSRRGIEFVLMPLVLMLSVIPSSINVGVRHILPIYPLLCILAAIGTAALWKSGLAMRATTAALCVWMFGGVALAHPDYLAWFNEAAGRHPERIAVDSNLDWGQDMLRLARISRARNMGTITLHCSSEIPFSRHGVTDRPLAPFTPTRGWVAVSETLLALEPDARRGGYQWLDRYKWERIGRSIRLYQVF